MNCVERCNSNSGLQSPPAISPPPPLELLERAWPRAGAGGEEEFWRQGDGGRHGGAGAQGGRGA